MDSPLWEILYFTINAILVGDAGLLSAVPLLYPNGSAVGFRSCSNINITTDDEIIEDDEVYTIYMNSSDPVIFSPNNTKNITVLNDDCELYPVVTVMSCLGTYW